MVHCKCITKKPEQAEMPNYVLKKQFVQEIVNRILSIQRTLPWGIYRPPGGVTDDPGVPADD